MTQIKVCEIIKIMAIVTNINSPFSDIDTNFYVTIFAI